MRFSSKIYVLAVHLALSSGVLVPTEMVVAMDNAPYHLVRIGTLSIQDNNANNQQIAGVVLGLRVTRSSYVEVEINLPLGGGEFDSGPELARYEISNLTLYGAYRYMLRPDYYVKAKAGIAYTPISIIADNNEIVSKGGGGAAGIGLGIVYNISNHPVMLEVEVAAITKGVVLYTLGINYPF